jgi:hypothetical protein
MPGKKIAQLQHSGKFVKKENSAVVRQTRMITGDFNVCRRSPHFEPHITFGEVRLKL